MLNRRAIATDATFLVLYIGMTAAMISLSLLLLGLLAIGAEFGVVHVAASIFNLLAWVTLPFAPRLYQKLVGHPFSWRANGVLGDDIDY